MIGDTLLLVTILIGQDRGRIEQRCDQPNYRSKRNALAGIMVERRAAAMEEEEID